MARCQFLNVKINSFPCDMTLCGAELHRYGAIAPCPSTVPVISKSWMNSSTRFLSTMRSLLTLPGCQSRWFKRRRARSQKSDETADRVCGVWSGFSSLSRRQRTTLQPMQRCACHDMISVPARWRRKAPRATRPPGRANAVQNLMVLAALAHKYSQAMQGWD